MWTSNPENYSVAEHVEAARQRLASGADPAVDPIVIKARVWNHGPNHNGVGIRQKSLVRAARTFVGCPVCVNHATEGPFLGHIRASKATADETGAIAHIDQEIAITTKAGLERLAVGDALRFSIGAQPVLGARLECTTCGQDLRDWESDCRHFPGIVRGGVRHSAEWSEVEGREVSVVATPAVDGTGIIASAFDDELFRILTARFARLSERFPMVDEQEETPRKPEISDEEAVKMAADPLMLAMQTELSELRAARAADAQAIEALRAENLARDSDKVLHAAYQGGRLRGEHKVLIALRAENPSYFDRVLACVPGNPAFAAGVRISTGIGGVQTTDQADWQAVVEERVKAEINQSMSRQEKSEARARIYREERNKGGRQ